MLRLPHLEASGRGLLISGAIAKRKKKNYFWLFRMSVASSPAAALLEDRHAVACRTEHFRQRCPLFRSTLLQSVHSAESTVGDAFRFPESVPVQMGETIFPNSTYTLSTCLTKSLTETKYLFRLPVKIDLRLCAGCATTVAETRLVRRVDTCSAGTA